MARDRVVIASKVYFNEGRLSREAIFREIDGSLLRLGTDYLDLYIIHRFDYDTPMEETMEALNDLVKTGKVRAIGVSAMYGYQFHNMQLIVKEHGFTPFCAMENHYNLLYREDEREHDLAEKYQCKMSQIAIAWHWAKGVDSPIIGATKQKYLDEAVGAFDIRLTKEDIAYLEEPYVPHPIVGAIDKNPPQGVLLLDEKK